MPNPLVDLTDAASATTALAHAGYAAPADLDAIITGVSAQMQQFANRNFVSQPYTRTVNGLGGDRLLLPDTPITAVSSLSIDGLVIPASSAVARPGYVFDELMIYLRGYRFCRGVQNVTVSYTAGYTPIPADLARAACEAVTAVVAAMEAGDPRVVELKAGGSSMKFAASPADLADICLTGNVTSVLNQRRREAPI